MRQGRADEAIPLFEEQVSLAEDAEESAQNSHQRSPAILAYNNLTVAWEHKHDYLQARAYALLALQSDKDNRAARVNLSRIERALQRWRWPNTISGEYIQYAGHGSWQIITIEPSTTKEAHFCFSGIWWGANDESRGPSGIGELSGTAAVADGRGVYQSNDTSGDRCVISMDFRPDKVELQQSGDDTDCGFGHNVRANGIFLRISADAKCSPE